MIASIFFTRRPPSLALQLFREVLAVKTASWGVTFTLPHAGHRIFASARSASVSVSSKLFPQLSHTNSYLGMSCPPVTLVSR